MSDFKRTDGHSVDASLPDHKSSGSIMLTKELLHSSHMYMNKQEVEREKAKSKEYEEQRQMGKGKSKGPRWPLSDIKKTDER